MIVDDHPLYREGVVSALSHLMQGTQVISAPTVARALAIMTLHPDLELVLIDLHLPEIDGFEALRQFGQRHPGVARVLISGQHIGEQLVTRAMQLGASGVIPKSLDVKDMVDAITQVLGGDTYLPDLSTHREDASALLAASPSPESQAHVDDIVSALSGRQLEVLHLVGQGRSNKDIARELNIAERTVKAHASRIFEVLGATNRTQAVLTAQKLGLLAA